MSRIMNVGLHPLRVGKFSTLVRPKNLVLLGGLFLFAVGILIFGLMHGSFSVPASEVGRALFAPENVSTDARYIVQDIRLPRVIMALLCGAMLGMAGAAMQSIARNGLADPGLIGVKEGCSVAVLWLIFQFPMLGMFWRPVAGLAGGFNRDFLCTRYFPPAICSDWYWCFLVFRRRYRCIYDHCRCSRCTNCIDVVIGKPACS